MSLYTAINALTGIGETDTGGEVARIMSLPDRGVQPFDWTPLLRRPGGSWTLSPEQNLILTEARVIGGVVACAPVGMGKSLCAFLLPTVMEARKALLVIPGAMRDDWRNERLTYTRQFVDPGGRLSIASYAQLCQPTGSGFLERERFDLIIADEADKLGDPKSRAASRILRYLVSAPETRFVAMSGSLDSNSVKRMMHLFAMALRICSPLPLDYSGIESLSLAVDPRRRAKPGALRKWQRLADKYDVPFDHEPRERVRLGLQARLRSAKGVVLISSTSYHGEVDLIRRDPYVPQAISDRLAYLDATWIDPEGFELPSHLDLARKSAEIAQGFFYRVQWQRHGCLDPAQCDYSAGDYRCVAGYLVDVAWTEARRAWFRAVREFLPGAETGVDSNALAGRAAEKFLQYYAGHRPRPSRYVPPHIVEAWRVWREHKEKVIPENEPVWLDHFLVNDAIQWVSAQSQPSIIWARHRAIADEIGRVGGLEVLGAGPDADERLVNICRQRDLPNIVLSIAAHGRGKNLQRYANGLVLYPPTGGTVWEQLIGRMARKGQTAKRVAFSVNLHTAGARKAIMTAVGDARYSTSTVGASRLLLKARDLIETCAE